MPARRRPRGGQDQGAHRGRVRAEAADPQRPVGRVGGPHDLGVAAGRGGAGAHGPLPLVGRAELGHKQPAVGGIKAAGHGQGRGAKGQRAGAVAPDHGHLAAGAHHDPPGGPRNDLFARRHHADSGRAHGAAPPSARIRAGHKQPGSHGRRGKQGAPQLQVGLVLARNHHPPGERVGGNRRTGQEVVDDLVGVVGDQQPVTSPGAAQAGHKQVAVGPQRLLPRAYAQGGAVSEARGIDFPGRPGRNAGDRCGGGTAGGWVPGHHVAHPSPLAGGRGLRHEPPSARAHRAGASEQAGGEPPLSVGAPHVHLAAGAGRHRTARGPGPVPGGGVYRLQAPLPEGRLRNGRAGQPQNEKV